jgi:sec-independent protein translocase protein TatA
MPQGADWIFIIVIAVLLFGGSQIPKLARSLGQAQKEFKEGLKEGATEDSDSDSDDDASTKG